LGGRKVLKNAGGSGGQIQKKEEKGEGGRRKKRNDSGRGRRRKEKRGKKGGRGEKKEELSVQTERRNEVVSSETELREEDVVEEGRKSGGMQDFTRQKRKQKRGRGSEDGMPLIRVGHVPV